MEGETRPGGIVKCRDVILNTVGANAGEYDIEVVEKVIQQMKEMDIAKKNKTGHRE